MELDSGRSNSQPQYEGLVFINLLLDHKFLSEIQSWNLLQKAHLERSTNRTNSFFYIKDEKYTKSNINAGITLAFDGK